MADTFNKTSHQVVQVVNGDQKLLYQVERCPECWGRSANEAICHTALGLLQEALHWVARGINFRVDEVECIAKGDSACTYLVQKRPRE
jgi:predicted hydrocarbon binding protein